MNKISFVGNLTRDPDLRTSSEGKHRATFSVAINEGEGDNEKTHFVNVTAFGTLGENVAASLKRGQRVIVEGRLDTYKKTVQIDGEDKELTMTNYIASAVGPDLRWATAEVSKVVSNRSEEQFAGDEPAAPAAAPAEAEAPKKSASASKKAASAARPAPAPADTDDEDF